jgi:hypothetical protein
MDGWREGGREGKRERGRGREGETDREGRGGGGEREKLIVYRSGKPSRQKPASQRVFEVIERERSNISLPISFIEF